MQNAKISYAQNREDVIIEGFFQDQLSGFYVDVGANDPDLDSVTKRFYLKGWTGMNLEPNAMLHQRLERKRPRDINVCVGAGEKNETKVFRQYHNGDGLSTLSEGMKAIHDKDNTPGADVYTDLEIKIKTLKSLFEEYNVNSIDFMKVDVEGFEFEALQGNDWSKYRPKLLCIEANHVDKDWRNLLIENSYQMTFFDGLNEYYVDTKLDKIPTIDYPQTAIAAPILKHEVYIEAMNDKSEIARLTRELNTSRIHVRHLLRLADEKQHSINQLNEAIRQMKRLKLAIKTAVRSFDTAISNRINRLNTADDVIVKLDPSNLPESDVVDIEAALQEIHKYDLTHSYIRHIKNTPRPSKRYVVASYVYVKFKKGAKVSVRGIKKMKKVIKR